MRLNLITPQLIAVGFFQKYPITQLITNYQLSEYGVDRNFNKFITNSKNIDQLQKTYSYPYAEVKRRITGDASKFNLKLTGSFHKSFYQVASRTYVAIGINSKFYLKKKYPTLLQLSNNAINIIISGDGMYVKQGLLQYARRYYLTHVVTK